MSIFLISIFRVKHYEPYIFRLRKFNLYRLEDRRTAIQLSMIHKIIHRHIDFDAELLFELSNRPDLLEDIIFKSKQGYRINFLKHFETF